MNKPSINILIPLVTFGALGLQLSGCANDGGTDGATTRDALSVSRAAAGEGTATTTTAAAARLAAQAVVKTPTQVVTTAPPPPPPPLSPPPTFPAVQAVEAGAGWQRVQVSGTAYDAQQGAVVTLGDEYYVINGRDAIAATSLSDATRAALAGKMKNAPLPATGDEEILIVPTRLNDAVQAGVAEFSICDDQNNQTYPVSYAIDQTYPYHVDTQGTFSGSGDFSVRVHGNVTGAVKYDVQYTFCIPTLVLHRVTVTGSASVIADAAIDASFSDTWSWSAQVAAPVLGTVTLPILPIPITFSVPITVGIDAAAKADLHAHATYEADGQFSVVCNGNGCDGTKSATSGFTPNGSPIFGVNGLVTVTPWAMGAVHANVLADWLAYAEVGVKARMPAQLWAYAGNTCGDGNNDGTPEWVSAATLDLGVGIDVVARAGFIGDDLGPWSWNVWNQHLGFWTLGDTSALNPIFHPTWPTADALRTARLLTKMRPCWPYTDAVTYLLTWNDGTTTTATGAPGTLIEVDHPYASYGTMVVDITAVSDAAGRSLGGTAESGVYLSPVDLHDLLNQSAGFAL
jgi:hypothetical protein